MNKYCLDTNFFIEGWNKYYSPDFCRNYWEIVAELGSLGIVFIPEKVKSEIDKVDDKLKEWLKNKKFLVRGIDENVQKCIKEIYAKDPSHLRLVDNTRNRSIADPWVIAHALSENAIVVTKEEKVTNPASNRIKIPNVCDNMGIRWIDDFSFIRELQIFFNCNILKTDPLIN